MENRLLNKEIDKKDVGMFSNRLKAKRITA